MQFDACAVCANNAIFAFVVVSIFLWRCVLVGGGGREMDKNPSKIVEGILGKKFGNHCLSRYV